MIEINKGLETLLSKEKAEEIKKKIIAFEKDKWLIGFLKSELEPKDGNYNYNDLSRLTKIIDSVISQEYKMEPSMLCNIYYKAINDKSFKRYSNIREHLNKLQSIEPSILMSSIEENKSGRDNDLPYNAKGNRYCSMLIDFLGSNDDSEKFEKRLGFFEEHF